MRIKIGPVERQDAWRSVGPDDADKEQMAVAKRMLAFPIAYSKRFNCRFLPAT